MATILVVDDLPTILRPLQLILRANNHTVVTAQSADEALKKFGEMNPKPDLILTDNDMPDDDKGLELIKALRDNKIGYAGPIILYSSPTRRTAAELEKRVHAIPGNNSFFSKGGVFPEVVEFIEKKLGQLGQQQIMP